MKHTRVKALRDLAGRASVVPTRTAAARLRERSKLWRELERLGVNVDALDQWLRERVRIHEAEQRVRANVPARADEVEFARALLARVREVERALDALPPRLHAGLVGLEFRRPGAVSWVELSARLRDDLVALEVLLSLVQARMSAVPARRGRKSQHGRDTLLAEITARLKAAHVRPAKARALAHELLRAEGVVVPSPTRPAAAEAAAKAARLGRK